MGGSISVPTYQPHTDMYIIQYYILLIIIVIIIVIIIYYCILYIVVYYIYYGRYHPMIRSFNVADAKYV